MSRALFDNRSKSIDYSRIENLFFIGSYERRLPVSLARMMENAYDWQHLPYVHDSSFKAIELVDEGEWGWQAVATLPDSRLQHLELLVDKAQNYWATTVLSGDAKGFQIHTHATRTSDNEIDVLINFYLPKGFSKVLIGLNLSKLILPFNLYKKIAKKLGVQRVTKSDTPRKSILNALHYQYSVLYDEDEALMSGRQMAIDRLKQSKSDQQAKNLLLGSIDKVISELPKVVQFGKHRYVVNQWQGKWVVYSADCPHLLGPLETSDIDEQGQVTCPWHGYKFNIITGKNCDQNLANLPLPPVISIVGNELILKTE